MFYFRHVLTTILSIGLFACAGDDAPATDEPQEEPSVLPQESLDEAPPCSLPAPKLSGAGLTAFGDGAELDSYLAAVSASCEAPGASRDAGIALTPTAGAAPQAEAPANESITNNQEVGVDEGGIVKNVGDHLVTLRKGRLYTVDVSAPGAPRQTDSVRVAASDALNTGVWYDELLAHKDILYVIGYRYSLRLDEQDPQGVSFSGRAGATEINVFRLTDGKFARLGQTFIESWDYFSGTNYASRLVDGQLIFYMPITATRGVKFEPEGKHYHGITAIPRVLHYDLQSERFSVVGPLFQARDVHRPLKEIRYPKFHSIVRCDLADSGQLACNTKAFLGGYARHFYVSPTRVYLWTADHVFAAGLRSWSLSAHHITGVPHSQFAFKELGDTLYVAATNGGEQNELAMWTLPLKSFDQSGLQNLEAARTKLVSSGGYLRAERFVGSVYVAALNAARWSSESVEGLRVFFDVAGSAGPQIRRTTLSDQRIEVLGDGRALVVGQSQRGAQSRSGEQGALTLESWTLKPVPARTSSLSLSGLAQGESRSHGFFYKPLDGGHGVFGLPVLTPTQRSGSWFGSGYANIAFFDISARHQMSTLGTISSTGAASACETSCIDWYGNTRPIFLRDRVFALMGSELVEASIIPKVTPVGQRLVMAPADQQR
jgi:hypothetical protein